MGWYSHPDTMAIASASHTASKETDGAARESLEYKRAYRKAYFEQNQNDGCRGFDDYIKEIDEEIAWLETGKPLDEFYAFQEARAREAWQARRLNEQ